MKRSHITIRLLVSIILLFAIAAESQSAPLRLRDLLWVWANPEMQQPGPHTAATFARAGATERARLLGVPNIALAGTGVPNDDAKADALTAAAAQAPRLLWETTPDGEGIGPPFVYTKRMAQIRRLAQRYPQIEAILLDDMSTGKIDRGFRAEHVRHIREELKSTNVKIWGVVYTMSLGREYLAECIRDIDVINLWLWHARDTADLEKYVSRLENDYPNKPIVLGIYLYDYGGKRRMPLDLLEKQCQLARKLAHAGRVEGIVFLTIHDDADAVNWVADWIKRTGNEQLHPPTGQSRVGTRRTTFKATSTGFTMARSKEAIVRAMTAGDQVTIDSSSDEGKSWQRLSAISQEGQRIATGYFSQTPPDSLLLTVTVGKKNSNDGEASQVCWVRSRDGGRSWSTPALMMDLAPSMHAWGPIAVMRDGRWVYCPYYEEQAPGTERRFRSMIMWSSDSGKTWDPPVAFPQPTDGNIGGTEGAVAEISPGNYLAAIRADEAPDPASTPSAFDGFYFSRSTDGIHWSPLESLGERGRMPRFYRFGDFCVLAYRLYNGSRQVQHSAIRFSRDGKSWTGPVVIENGVALHPELVEVRGKIIAFNYLLPYGSNLGTRNVVRIPDLVYEQTGVSKPAR